MLHGIVYYSLAIIHSIYKCLNNNYVTVKKAELFQMIYGVLDKKTRKRFEMWTFWYCWIQDDTIFLWCDLNAFFRIEILGRGAMNAQTCAISEWWDFFPISWSGMDANRKFDQNLNWVRHMHSVHCTQIHNDFSNTKNCNLEWDFSSSI